MCDVYVYISECAFVYVNKTHTQQQQQQQHAAWASYFLVLPSTQANFAKCLESRPNNKDDELS